MKGRLKDSATLAMKWFLASEQAIADQLADQGGASVADEFMLTRDEQLLNEIGIVNQVNALMKYPEGRNGAVLARGVFEKVQHVSERTGSEEAQGCPTAGTRWMPHISIFAISRVTELLRAPWYFFPGQR